MKIWLILIQAEEGTIWVEGAWDDDMTADNHAGWKAEVDQARELVEQNPGYEMRICSVTIPGLLKVFDIPELEGNVE